MRVGKLDYRISNELSRTVPSDFSTAIDIENLCAISWAFLGQSALASGVDRRMLEQNQGVRAIAS
jgi:hypothetical protein